MGSYDVDSYPGRGGGGVLPYMDYIGMCRCAAVKGMVFKQFTLG